MGEDLFLSMGLTESEKKVYLALLDLGDSTRSDIISTSKIAGSKVYEVLDKLHQKGFISIYTQNKVKHFKALNPNQIFNYLDSKKEEITKLEKKAKDMLPKLMAKFNDSKKDSEVELITGLKGLQIIFREQIETLKPGETCYVIGGTNGFDEGAPQAFFERIHLQRDKKRIKTKMLFNKKQKNQAENSYSSKQYKNTTTKYINHTSPVAINIYKDKTIIIIFGLEITSISIISKDIANSFLEYFNLLWKTAK